MPFPTPHLDKLNALLENEKLPPIDKPRVESAVEKYRDWIANLEKVTGTADEQLQEYIRLLNEYRFWIDVDLVFDSPDDFLYRQKGQLKLDSSILEEFLPRLATPIFLPELLGINVNVGPAPCFSSLYFDSSLDAAEKGIGLTIKTKNQDFAISRQLYFKVSHDSKFTESSNHLAQIGYIVAECKTNLDKTMFQEACATAHDIKSAVTGAHYFLLCEWLDMAPISTKSTEIDEVLILRKAKRQNSNVRKSYSKASKRKAKRPEYVKFLTEHPFHLDIFQRFLAHLRRLLKTETPIEEEVLNKGYF